MSVEGTVVARLARAARRLEGIAPFRVVEILARAREMEAAGRSIIHMEIGEPDFDTPAPVLEAARRALGRVPMHYAQALGIPPLREAIASFYRARYGVDVPARRVIVTPGSSGALLLALAALVDPGARVLMADPGYPANRHFVRFLDGVPVGVPAGPQTGYQLDHAAIAAHWCPRTVAAIVATPSNPTGTLVGFDALAAILAAVRERGGTLLIDEIYHGLVYGDAIRTALAAGDDVIVVNSFSKYFGMTGWRIGWMVVPEALVEPIERTAQNVFIATATLAQHAALAAFEPATLAILEERRAAFRARRDFLVPALVELGFEVPVVPQGAFYVYADASRLTSDALTLCRDLLEHAGVAVTPGIDFGEHRCASHVRFAYTSGVERLREGVERIARYLGR